MPVQVCYFFSAQRDFVCELLGTHHTELFSNRKISSLEQKNGSLYPCERDRLVRVFNFFNGDLEKKLGGMNFLIEKIEPECR
jgi:hypothetical protein